MISLPSTVVLGVCIVAIGLGEVMVAGFGKSLH